MNYRLITAYDGTDFHGWQEQLNAPEVRTVQGELRQCLEKILRHPVELQGSSRTDAGVHAWGHLSNFHTDNPILPQKIIYALNGMTKDDLLIRSIDIAPKDFNARFDSKGKKYCYRFAPKSAITPFNRRTTSEIKGQPDIQAIKNAIPHFIGNLDFKAFTCNSGTPRDNTTREIYATDIYEVDGVVSFTVQGKGFLYKMVRCLAGALIAVGQKKLHPDDILEMLQTKIRNPRYSVAEAKGLRLEEVYY